MTSTHPLTSDDQKLRELFRRIEVFIFLTFTLGAVFYADRFHIWEHALSEISTTRTLQGTPNLLSTAIISLGMILVNAHLLEIAALYRKNADFPHHQVKSILMYMAGMGSLLSIFPNNHFHLIHSIGSGMLIGPFYIINLLFLWERKQEMPRLWWCLLTLILSITVLWYAGTFFMNMDIKQIAQKFCVVSILFILHQRASSPIEIPESHLTHRPA
jgi:hypothetical protein